MMLLIALLLQDGYLGVELEQDAVALRSVVEDGPADRAGLKAGDVILEVDGEEVSSTRALIRRVQARKAGDEVALKIERDGETRDVTVKLGERPAMGGMRLSLKVGDAAPAIELKDLDGNEVKLADLAKDKPVVIEFGAFT